MFNYQGFDCVPVVILGLDPRIHLFNLDQWILGSSPMMTGVRLVNSKHAAVDAEFADNPHN